MKGIQDKKTKISILEKIKKVASSLALIRVERLVLPFYHEKVTTMHKAPPLLGFTMHFTVKGAIGRPRVHGNGKVPYLTGQARSCF